MYYGDEEIDPYRGQSYGLGFTTIVADLDGAECAFEKTSDGRHPGELGQLVKALNHEIESLCQRGGRVGVSYRGNFAAGWLSRVSLGIRAFLLVAQGRAVRQSS